MIDDPPVARRAPSDNTWVATFRAAIRVLPGARAERVGGSSPARHRGQAPALVVRVPARPVAGQATEAALRAVASALQVRPRQVRLVSGATSREKVVEVLDPAPDIADRWAALLDRDA